MAFTNATRLYQYRSIPSPSIRLLELLPGAPASTLQCKLHNVHLSSRPPFSALSYTWGPPIFPHILTETTTLPPSTLRITSNLYQALQALRHPLSSRTLWIDAVCINQADNVEKGQQVQLMGAIYRSAERVLVWLGKSDCVAAVQELNLIGRNCHIYGFDKIFPFPTKIHDHSAAENLERLIESCDGEAILEYLDREWFERVWIVQEFILAKDLVVVSGNSEISYDLFSKAMCVLKLLGRRPVLIRRIGKEGGLWKLLTSGKVELSWRLIQNRERYMVLNSMATISDSAEGAFADPDTGIREENSRIQDADGEGLDQATTNHTLGDQQTIHRTTLVEYCVGARTLKCTNERDRVYGMLGFAGDMLSIQPDYDNSPEQVWKDLAIKSLLSGDLTILHWARGVPAQGDPKGLSFVADLGNLNTEAPRLGGIGTPKFHAATQAAVQVKLIPQGLPRLRGVVVDVVENECFLGLAPTSKIGEESAATPGSLMGLDGHREEQSPGRLPKDALVQVHDICKSWISGNAF
jgi:hypothetical protein